MDRKPSLQRRRYDLSGALTILARGFPRFVLKRLYFWALYRSGRAEKLLEAARQQRLVLVLNLHRVSPERNPYWNPLCPRLFEDLLDFLARRCVVTTFRHLEQEAPGRARVVLSFDDGYHDFAEYACPLLAKRGFSANLNVIPECIETGQPPMNVRLLNLLHSAPPSALRELRLPGFTLSPPDGDSEKLRFALAIDRFLKLRPRAELLGLWQHVDRWSDRFGALEATRMLTRDEVRSLAREHEIGAHGYAHDSMAFESDEFFALDVTKCSDYFDAVLGQPLEVYAFPNGSFRAEQIHLLRQRGIRYVLLVEERLATGKDGVFARLTFYGDSSAETRLRAAGYAARGHL